MDPYLAHTLHLHWFILYNTANKQDIGESTTFLADWNLSCLSKTKHTIKKYAVLPEPKTEPAI